MRSSTERGVALTTSDKQKKLEELFRHDWLARQAERELVEDDDRQGLARVLRAATEQARSTRGEEATEVRLEVLASLWSQVGTEEAAGMLAELMLDPNIDVRHAAGEGLTELSEEDFELFARTVRRTLSSGAPFGPEVEQLAFLLSEVDEPRVIELILAMLDHDDEQVVVAALEIAGEWAWDDRVSEALSRLTRDTRSVTVDDAEEGKVALGVSELATQITETLRTVGGAGKHG